MTGQTLAIILSQSAALICLGAYLREYRLRLRLTRQRDAKGRFVKVRG